MKKLVAYHGSAELKQSAIDNIRAHRQAERLIQGSPGRIGADGISRGRAVFCTIGIYDHAAYESKYGVYQLIARLEDGIFEGLPEGEWESWSERFLQAIEPGADLSLVGSKFLHWLLVDPVDGVIRFAKSEASRNAIQAVGNLYLRQINGEVIEKDAWRAAAAAAAAAEAEAAAEAAAGWRAAARYEARIKQASKLLELLASAPMMVEVLQ